MNTWGTIYLNLASTEVKLRWSWSWKVEKAAKDTKSKMKEEEGGKQFHNNQQAGDGRRVMSL